jgi:hypothetical protein
MLVVKLASALHVTILELVLATIVPGLVTVICQVLGLLQFPFEIELTVAAKL